MSVCPNVSACTLTVGAKLHLQVGKLRHGETGRHAFVCKEPPMPRITEWQRGAALWVSPCSDAAHPTARIQGAPGCACSEWRGQRESVDAHVGSTVVGSGCPMVIGSAELLQPSWEGSCSCSSSSSSSVSPCQSITTTMPGEALSMCQAHRATEADVRGAGTHQQPLPPGTRGAPPHHHHAACAGMSGRAARTRTARMREQGELCRIPRLGPSDSTARSQERWDRAAGRAAALPSVTQRGRGEHRRFTAPAPRAPRSPRPFGTAAAAGEVECKK